MLDPSLNKIAIRANKQRLRNKIKSLKLTLKPRPQPEQVQSATLSHVPKVKSLYYSTPFQSVFELGEKIGQGAHGVVRKCVEKSTGATYCVKITHGDEEYIRISKKTYQLLCLIDSRHVIKPKSLFISEARHTIYLVMEHCRYPSLQRCLSISPNPLLTPMESQHIIKTLLEGVCDMHRVGVCHRDLKPDNILHDRRSGHLKIIDLGISKLIYNKKKDTKEKMWTVTGTLEYKAPEMFLGEEYDELVDSWAVGVITYQIMYGRMPFQADLLADLIELIVNAEVDYPEDIVFPNHILAIDFMKSLLCKAPRRSSCFEAAHHPWVAGTRSRLSSEDIANQEVMFARYREMSVETFNERLSPPTSTVRLSSDYELVTDSIVHLDLAEHHHQDLCEMSQQTNSIRQTPTIQ